MMKMPEIGAMEYTRLRGDAQQSGEFTAGRNSQLEAADGDDEDRQQQDQAVDGNQQSGVGFAGEFIAHQRQGHMLAGGECVSCTDKAGPDQAVAHQFLRKGNGAVEDITGEHLDENQDGHERQQNGAGNAEELIHPELYFTQKLFHVLFPLSCSFCWLVGIGDLGNIHYSRVSSAPMNL